MRILFATAALGLYAVVSAFGPTKAVLHTTKLVQECARVTQEHSQDNASLEDVRKACEGTASAESNKKQ